MHPQIVNPAAKWYNLATAYWQTYILDYQTERRELNFGALGHL